METLRITISQEDIEEGVPDNPNRCPLAQGFRRAEHTGVYSGTNGVQYGPDKWVPHTPESSRFMMDFDIHGPKAVKPCTLQFTPTAASMARTSLSTRRRSAIPSWRPPD